MAKNEEYIKILPTKKFKTTTVTLKFMAPLDYKTITQRSLLSKLLVRASKKWSTDKMLNKHLAELYGAYVNSTVSKFKDKHVITITLEIVNERYLNDKTPLFEKGLELLYELIWNPLITNHSFDETFLNQEKALLTKKIEAFIDNKSQYAFSRFMNYMFENESYRYLASGQLENIPKVTPENLYDTYQSMIKSDLCSVYVVGNVDEQLAKRLIEEKLPISKHDFEFNLSKPELVANKDINYIEEVDTVDQAKLNFGFRFPTNLNQENYYAFVVFNMMFGGDPSSVLFSEVREKLSLAYSIHSQVDGKNGYLFVLSGVSLEKYELAKDTILKEFEKLQHGEFEKEQLELAKQVVTSQRYEAMDRAKSIIELMHNQILLEQPLDNEKFIEKVNQVTKEDIVNLINEAQLDTIYVLKKGGNSIESSLS